MTKCFRWVLVLSLTTSAATAQSPSDSSALARELFAHGRTLMDTGDYAGACAKFAESQRLNPGGGTLLNLALCNEKQGKTATAWALFNQAIVLARRDGRSDREVFAKEHVDALAPSLSRLVIHVPKGARAPGLTLKLNGVEIGAAAWGTALPVDPGRQEISLSAPAKLPRSFSAEVAGDGARVELTVDKLADAPRPPPARRKDADDRRAATPERVLWPYWTAAGVFGVAAGVLTVKAYRSHTDAEDERDRFGVTGGEYDSAREQAQKDALFADIAWGVTAASAGVALWVTLSDSKPETREKVRVGAGLGGLRVDGRF